MKILSIECSAGPASAAVIDDGRISGSYFVNIKTTHSQTLMPMVSSLLDTCNLTPDNIDGIAVAAGPGSFTGIRIGISAVKGLAAVRNIPCVAVSTLRAMAEPFKTQDCIVCAVMDARCNQVYNALFKVQNGIISRLCEDRALMCNELSEEIKTLENENLPVIVTGDGSDLFYPFVQSLEFVRLSDITQRFQNASAVGLASIEDFENNNTTPPDNLLPVYLRLPQAERELKKKQSERNDG